jgi:subtilisin family serine protease
MAKKKTARSLKRGARYLKKPSSKPRAEQEKRSPPKAAKARGKYRTPWERSAPADGIEKALFAFRMSFPRFADPTFFGGGSATADSSLALTTATAVYDPPPLSSDNLKTRLSAVVRKPLSDLKRLKLQVETSMDPRLQLALANYRVGKRGPEFASTAGDEIAVIARVNSVEAWNSLADIDPGVVLGKTPDGSTIVTGRLPVKRLEAVRTDKNVLSLKASQPIHPTLKMTVESMEVSDTLLPPGTSPDGGRGVVIGIVDFGCDFAHQNFRQKKNGKTRILTLWNQGATTSPGGGVTYGRAYSSAEIDKALASANPYITLGYGPSNELGGTHGTHVMDIAAGNGNGTQQSGVAPKADIIFVEAATDNLAWMSADTAHRAFGDSTQLVEAVRFIFNTAGDRPCVCNISLGTNGGPHDGTSLVEQSLDAMVREQNNRAVVIAAGNSQTDDIHASGTVKAGEDHQIAIKQQSEGGAEFQLWYNGAQRLQVSLLAPDGTVFGPVQPGANSSFGAPNQIAIFIGSRLDDPNNHDNVIGIWIAEGLSEENFIVQLRSVDDKSVDYHAWLERNDRRQASFVAPVHTHALGSISTGHETVAVGSYDAHKPTLPISSFSGSGPTRDGRNKPEVSAPGQFVLAAKSGTVNGVTKKSGTSMAAPAVTGLIALIYSEAKRNGENLTIAALRSRLMNACSLNPPVMEPGAWNSVYGYGRAGGKSVG